MNIGKKITELRLLNGIKSITALSKISGLSQSYISQIENGTRKCPLESLNSICEALNISMSDFFKDAELSKKQLEYINVIKLAESFGITTKDLEQLIQIIAKTKGYNA
jgi:transcriptional regulator with XRE-family HTH domain